MARPEGLFTLEERVIVITGAAGLLGRQHAEAVAAYGGYPVLVDLDEDAVAELAERLRDAYGVRARGSAVDITDEAEIREHVEFVQSQFGKIDGLVNNAANNPKVEGSESQNFTRLENFPLSHWDADISVGLTGAYLCAKHYGFLMSKNPSGGSIVNISSDLGLIAPDQRLYRKEDVPEEMQIVKPVTYSVVKAGLLGLTRYLATYWAEQGVRCNAICPGGVENGQAAEFLEKVADKIPMRRLARPDEYRGTLVWMLSAASSYLNGAVICVDGGRTAW